MKVYLVFEHSTMAYEEADYLQGVYANEVDAVLECNKLKSATEHILYTEHSVEEWELQ